MSTKKTAMFLVIFLLILFTMTIFPHDAMAQKAGAGADKQMATKEGLPTKEFDKNQLPGMKEIGLCIGSIVAAIAAFKYL